MGKGMPWNVRRLVAGLLLFMTALTGSGGALGGEEGGVNQWNGETELPAQAVRPPRVDDGEGSQGGDTAMDSVLARFFDPVSSGVIVAVSWGVLAVLLIMRRRVAKTS